MNSSDADDRRSFLFLLGSTRAGGNTETLARHAAAGLPADARVRWLRLADLPLPAFEDVRHSGSGRYPEPVGNGRVLLDATLAATDLVIASPLYWYTVSADVKAYLDHWAGWMRVPGVDFRARMRDKRLWAVSTISDEDPTTADPMLGTLRLTADYLGMHWGGALLGYGNRPGDVLADTAALARAETFFARHPALVA
ncbi:Multimeric flavodoxin WrbA [Micromonospora viridifaciens]|uniref:Multimeric flavodoxin WrbA n=1 Tax=Micromonospora viridifaciens TaxID=1881 RepID=A0A1C4UIK5_MICVI|nr:NAD(P)H-dependent oxidoreductase [Micromonospora viridifaciens]SCE71514.1 Multimeric flavodoxin WrbA [Micromonospora viridifaciens]